MNYHRRLAVVSLVLGPFVWAVADLLRRLVDHSNGSDATLILHAIADHPGLWHLAASLSLLGAVLTVPGLVAAIGLVRGRGAVLTGVGGYLFGLGLLASLSHMVESYGFYGIVERSGLPTSTALTLDDTSYPVLSIVTVLFIAGLVLGQLLLLVGLRRARLVPIWAVVACVVDVVAGSTGGVAAGIVGVLAWVATFAPVALAVHRDGVRWGNAVDALPVVATTA
jgi:hypothetical protein